jgi:hypothetical protein
VTKPPPKRASAQTPAAPDPTPDPFRQTIEIARGPNEAGLSDMTHAAHGIEPDRRAADDETELQRLAEAEAAGALPAADRRADAAAPTPKET